MKPNRHLDKPRPGDTHLFMLKLPSGAVVSMRLVIPALNGSSDYTTAFDGPDARREELPAFHEWRAGISADLTRLVGYGIKFDDRESFEHCFVSEPQTTKEMT